MLMIREQVKELRGENGSICDCIPLSAYTKNKRHRKNTSDSANAISRWKDNLLDRFTRVL